MFWKPHCCAKFLFMELETSDFGYMLIFYSAELCKFEQDWTN